MIDITQLKGVGPKIAEKLRQASILNAVDLLFLLPTHYHDKTCIHPIATLKHDQYAYIEADIVDVKTHFARKPMLVCHLRDLSGHLNIIFFHFNHGQKEHLLEPQQKIRCYGKVRAGRFGLEMTHPEYELFAVDEALPLETSLTPIYPSIEGIGQKQLQKLIQQVLPYLEKGYLLEDPIPPSFLEKYALMPLSKALKTLHQPEPWPPEQLEKKLEQARKRLAFDELLKYRLAILRAYENQAQKSVKPMLNFDFSKKISATLPYQLTTDQKNALVDIQKDFQKNKPMLRLLQGDVGSGKTIVAALAATDIMKNGQQVAFMVPTELLAEQHFKNLKNLFQPLNIECTLLTSSNTSQERKLTLEKIKNNSTHCIIGTHALFQESVEFFDCGLVIIDEQHRFGVQQRSALQNKAENNNTSPHVLIMTATPIPRTLAMVLYADFAYSVIRELPMGRKPIKTVAMPNTKRNALIERIATHCQTGHQVYWICTLVEDSENLAAESAESTAHTLQEALPQLSIGLAHGRLNAKEKSQALIDFYAKKFHLLVATTVIEVGIDVPNANLIIIENAERLGLAQLHQLRGRVGRGDAQSFCVLLYQEPLTEFAVERLNALREHTDGFHLAEIDLTLRGPGELFGHKQTGDEAFRFANLLKDADLLSAINAYTNRSTKTQTSTTME